MLYGWWGFLLSVAGYTKSLLDTSGRRAEDTWSMKKFCSLCKTFGSHASTDCPTPLGLTDPDPIGSTAAEDLHGSSTDARGYFGSKNGAGVWQTIVNQIPPHTLWIEAFAGSAAITRRKRPAAASIVIDADPAVADRLQSEISGSLMERVNGPLLPAGVRVVCADAISWLEKHKQDFNHNTVIYCDPPYLYDSRSCHRRKRYQLEMGEQWLHGPLLEMLFRFGRCRRQGGGPAILISHYRHELYDRILTPPVWRRVDYTAQTHGGPRTECLWCNFEAPTELHDYSVAGRTFRQRQDLKRKQARWIAKLAAMPALERAAVLGAINEWSRSLPSPPLPSPLP